MDCLAIYNESMQKSLHNIDSVLSPTALQQAHVNASHEAFSKV